MLDEDGGTAGHLGSPALASPASISSNPSPVLLVQKHAKKDGLVMKGKRCFTREEDNGDAVDSGECSRVG